MLDPYSSDVGDEDNDEDGYLVHVNEDDDFDELVAAHLRHISVTHRSTRKYMNMTLLFADQIQGACVA